MTVMIPSGKFELRMNQQAAMVILAATQVAILEAVTQAVILEATRAEVIPRLGAEVGDDEMRGRILKITRKCSR
jgi:hypothetical protein